MKDLMAGTGHSYFLFSRVFLFRLWAGHLSGTRNTIWNGTTGKYGIYCLTKRAEVIKLDEIESVNIKLFEIELILKNGIKTIKLDNLEFEDIRRIKERFGGIAHDKH